MTSLVPAKAVTKRLRSTAQEFTPTLLMPCALAPSVQFTPTRFVAAIFS